MNIGIFKSIRTILLKFIGIFCFLFLNLTYSIGEDLRRIYISDNYASYMYFTENMKRAELGVPDDIDAKIEGNTIKITALQKFDYPTNLTVYSESGAVYAFFVSFQKEPQTLYYSVEEKESLNKKNMSGPKPREKSKDEILAEEKLLKIEEEKRLEKLAQDSIIFTNCEEIIKNFDSGSPVSGDRKGAVSFFTYPTLAKDNYLYFIVSFKNDSKIDYHIENIFTSEVSRKKRTKRSAVIANMIKPYIVYQEKAEIDNNIVKADGGIKTLVLAFKRFTIDDDKLLQWEVYEVGGERNMKTKITAKTFYRANDF